MSSPSDYSIQDPVLRNYVLGYNIEYPFVWDKLFPVLNVNSESGTYATFGKEQLVVPDTAEVMVAMGAEPQYIDFAISSGTYKLAEFALGAKSFRRERQQAQATGQGIFDYEAQKMLIVDEKMKLFKEKYVADLVSTTTNYDATNYNTLDNTITGKYKWNHANADPIANLQAGIEAIMDDIGMMPNVVVYGFDSAQALVNYYRNKVFASYDPDPIKAAQMSMQGIVSQVSSQLGMTGYIGVSRYATTLAAATLSKVWGDVVVLAYVSPSPAQKRQDFGRTLTRTGYPIITREVLPGQDQTVSMQQRELYVHKISNWDAAYLINDTV